MAFIDNAESPTVEWVRAHQFTLTIKWRDGRSTLCGFTYRNTASAMVERLLSSADVLEVRANF